jgi:NAD(P)-dependent dehydrogenase (short-subunit alcohol dehydrogenase family)
MSQEFAGKIVVVSGGSRGMGRGIAADLRTEAGCKAVFDLVTEKYARCDVLFNSAGATKAGAFLDLPDASWQDGFALKFFGCVNLCRMFWPLLKDAQGHVVNIIGGAARTPDAGFLIGGSVNAAMHNFTKGMFCIERLSIQAFESTRANP